MKIRTRCLIAIILIVLVAVSLLHHITNKQNEILILKGDVLVAVPSLHHITLRHVDSNKITLRYVDSNKASIAPDRSVRIKAPVTLHQSGYRFQGISYHPRQHMVQVAYSPTTNPLAQVKKTKYIGVTFQPTVVPIINRSQTDPFNLSRRYDGTQTGRDTLRILVGNSATNMKVVSANYPAVNVRDPSIMKQGKRYYIIYTRGLMYTTDFNHWHQVKWPTEKQFTPSMDWAPEFVKDQAGHTKIIMSVCETGSSRHQLVMVSFKHGHVQQDWTKVSGNLPYNTIDPNLQYADGKYWLCCKNEQTRQLVIGSADNLTGPYQMQNIEISNPQHFSLEGPEALINHGHVQVFFDTYTLPKNGAATFHGLHYVERNLNDSSAKWSKMKTVHTNPFIVFRHGQIINNR